MALGLRLRARHHYVKGRAKSVARSKKTDGTVPNGLGGLWMPVGRGGSQAIKGPRSFLSVKFALEHSGFAGVGEMAKICRQFLLLCLLDSFPLVCPSYETLKHEKKKELIVHLEVRH